MANSLPTQKNRDEQTAAQGRYAVCSDESDWIECAGVSEAVEAAMALVERGDSEVGMFEIVDWRRLLLPAERAAT